MDIFVNVIGQKMCLSSHADWITAGSQRFVRFKFDLSEDWNGLVVFAQFRQKGKAYNQYLDQNNCVFLPAEIDTGNCTMMLYGSYDTVIGTTNYITLNVGQNRLISDADSTDISESLYNQLVTKIENLVFDGDIDLSGYVKTVNGKKPDGNGNVEIEVGSNSGQNVAHPDLSQNDPTKPDYIKNRTHWEESSQTVIEWDGNTEGLEQWDFAISGIMLYKVSDATPTLDELYGCLLGAQMGDDYVEMELVGQDYNDVVDLNNEVNPVNCKFIGRFFIVYDTDINFSGQAFTLTSTGIWATHDFRKLVYGTNTVHPLDEKFIPDTIARKSDIVPGDSGGVSSWNDLLDKPSTLPNPNSLIFTGAVNASYDGSEEVVVEIPVVEVPVTSVNGMTGDVQINIPTSSVTSVNGMTGDVQIDIPESTGSNVVVTLTVTEWTEQVGADGNPTGIFTSVPACSHTFKEIDEAYNACKTIIFDLIESGNDDAHTYLALIEKTKMNGETTYQFGIDFGNSIMNGYFSRYATRPTVSRKVYMDKITVDSASVGQTVVVKSVDSKGVPTAWEAVDLLSGAAVQPDLNQNDPTKPDYVKNRTHWEEGSQTVIEWDGNTEGRDNIIVNGSAAPYYKVSDLVPTIDDVIGAIVETNIFGIHAPINIEDIMAGEDCILVGNGIGILVVYATEFALEGTSCSAPSEGIYFLIAPAGSELEFPKSFTYGSVTIHRLDPKFLPEGGFGWEEASQIVIEWDSNGEYVVVENLIKISDLTPTASELIGAYCYYTMNGEQFEFEFTENDIDDTSEEMGVIQWPFGLVAIDPPEFAGTYVFSGLENEGFSNLRFAYGGLTVHQLDKKFIPDTIARVSDIPSPEIFIVNATEGELKESIPGYGDIYELTTDHTYEEVKAASDAGQTVFIRIVEDHMANWYPLIFVDKYLCLFQFDDGAYRFEITGQNDGWELRELSRFSGNEQLAFSYEVGNFFGIDIGDGLEMQYPESEDGWPALAATKQVPTVTTENNGAILQVVDGVWTAVKLTDVSVEGA